MRTRSIAICWLSLALLGIFAATLRASAVRSATAPVPSAVELTPDQIHRVYLPCIEKAEPIRPVLRNGGFEELWGTESSHRCLVFETNGVIWETVVGEIFTPPGWVAWFKHGMPVEHDPDNRDGWAQPESRDTYEPESERSPARMHSGAKAQMLFTFWKVHDAGFFQQVAATPGQILRVTAWAHAWSETNNGIHDDKGWCSEGSHVGCNPFFAYEGTPGLDWADVNFTFWVGIDPTGGTNPYADTVVWGPGAHIYNAYYPVPPAIAVARNSTVTVFLRSLTLRQFMHNDAYWDDIAIEVVQP